MEMQNEQKCQELFTLTIEQFAHIIELGIPMEAIFIMECLVQGTNPELHIKSHKVGAIFQLLRRKNFLSKDNHLTESGLKIYESLRCGGAEIKSVVKKVKDEIKTSFDEWWEAYPSSDGFTMDGKFGKKSFPRTGRVLKQGEEKCRSLFTTKLSESKYTAQQVIDATKAHIEQVKQTSYKTGKNGLTYFPLASTYINGEVWKAYFGVEQEEKEPEQTFNGFNG